MATTYKKTHVVEALQWCWVCHVSPLSLEGLARQYQDRTKDQMLYLATKLGEYRFNRQRLWRDMQKSAANLNETADYTFDDLVDLLL